MKALKMTLYLSITFAAMITCAATNQKQFKLKYLSEITHGPVIHTITVQAADENQAIVSGNKKCVQEMLDRNMSHEDVIDRCNNPRL